MPAKSPLKKAAGKKSRAGIAKAPAMPTVLQLKITLSDTEPAIWRRVLVKDDMTFCELHHAIQLSMGWTNSHMHEFVVDGVHLGSMGEGFDMGEDKFKNLDENSTLLNALLRKPAKRFLYEYDFGDGWLHLIQVEKILPYDGKSKYPACTGGAMNCPPEDCGGIPGFYDLLEILADKKHPERKEMLEWLGNPYDPEKFDMKKANHALSYLGDLLEE